MTAVFARTFKALLCVTTLVATTAGAQDGVFGQYRNPKGNYVVLLTSDVDGRCREGESVAILLAPDHFTVIDAGCWSFNEVGMVQIESSDGGIYLTPRGKFEESDQ
jgi:hypothetical protein